MEQVINLFLMDMSQASNTSGVDRYINTLIYGLKDFPYIHVHWVHLKNDSKFLFPKEERFNHYVKYSIPLPQYPKVIISESFWMRQFNEQVYRLIKHLFEDKDNCITHLHTLNLIDLAIYIRERTKCRIITHLHCIPWKGLYNFDKKRFNKIYELTYMNSNQEISFDEYVTNNCELLSYSEPDVVICVTECANRFLMRCLQIHNQNIKVIPNGINDYCHNLIERKVKTPNDEFHFLYVGVVNESKGISFILKALDAVRVQGYRIKLTVAGANGSSLIRMLKTYYPNLHVEIKGRLPFEKLKQLYSICDIGIIASLQEQSSYVAIEMAMFGLPIITTAVDGLDEMFTDGLNALKVETHFSTVLGLTVDVEMMVRKIILLINDNKLREELSVNARKLYANCMSLGLMVNRTVNVYKELIDK